MGRVGGAAPDLTSMNGGYNTITSVTGSRKTKAAAVTGKQKPPPLKGPVFLYFVDMSEDDVARAAAAGTKSEVRQILKDCMGIDQPEGLRTEVLCDLHYHNYAFCMSRDFSPDKIATFLAIMKRVLEEAVERKLPVDEAFDVFKTWLLKHSVERPPWSVGIFTFDDVQALTDYVHSTFFRHYKLYMHTYMTRCDVDIRVDRRSAGLSLPRRQVPLRAADEDDPKANPTFAYLFRPSEHELAEQAMRKLQEPPQLAEDRAALIKRKVAEGVKDLMSDFETKLKAQDENFKAAIDGR